MTMGENEVKAALGRCVRRKGAGSGEQGAGPTSHPLGWEGRPAPRSLLPAPCSHLEPKI